MPELQRTSNGGAHKQTIRNVHDSYESKVVKRDRSVASTDETLQGIGANQTSEQHLQKPASPSDTESSGGTKINQDFKRQDNPLRATGCITEDNDWHPTESATYDRTIRHHGTSHGCQGSREDDCVRQSDQQSLQNNVHENPMGGGYNAKTVSLGILGSFTIRKFNHLPVRCYKCQKFQHTSRTCRSSHDVCGLCGGKHRTKLCVEKRNKNEDITLNCSNCQGAHSTASNKCPVRKASIKKIQPATKPADVPLSNAKQVSQPAFVPTMEDFPIATSRKQSLIPRRLVPATPSFHHLDNSTDKKLHVSTPVTPQKKRLASGDGKTDIIRKTVVADKTPLAPPRSGVQQVQKNTQKPTPLKTPLPQDLPPSNM